MPRFTVKDLLIGMAIIAGGLGTAIIARNILRHSHIPNIEPTSLIGFVLWGVGGATAGAGLFYPIKKPAIGAHVGIIVAVVLLLMDLLRLI